MPEVSDEQILSELRTGGEQSLARWFEHYRNRLERMVHFQLDPRLSGRSDVSDVLQEAFLAAARRLPEFVAEPAAPFYVWLRGITANALADVHRRHLGAQRRDAGKEMPLAPASYSNTASGLLAASLVGKLTSPSQAAMRQETSAQLQQALARIDAVDREVLILRHFEQLGNNEVAAVLSLTKTAASKRYVRALARLKEVLVSSVGFSQPSLGLG
jgi:RNA polymerase sigma-70 factor (ECF subfamily)